MEIFHNLIDKVFSNSYVFDRFRDLVHSNYKGEKRIILKYFDKNRLTLDFGCGAGQFSVLFNPNKYYGVDTDKKYVKFSKEKRKGNFSIIKESPPYNFNKNYFDQVLISAVIHHIDDNNLKIISKELKRILKTNGRLMIVDHFRKENQGNLICKGLIFLDRGRYFRDLNQTIKVFSKEFKVEKTEIFKNGPYKDYILILSK